MALLTNEQRANALRNFAAWFEKNASPAERLVASHTNRAATVACFDGMMAALESALPTIRTAGGAAFTNPLKNKMLRFAVIELIPNG